MSKFALLILFAVSVQAAADEKPALPQPSPQQMDLATRLGIGEDDPIYSGLMRKPANDDSDIEPLTSPDGN